MISFLILLFLCSRAYFDGFNALIGNDDSANFDFGIEMKSNKELYEVAEQTQNSYRKYQTVVIQMHIHCYFREFLPCASLVRKYQTPHTAKRSFDFLIDFYDGIGKCTHLCLAPIIRM